MRFRISPAGFRNDGITGALIQIKPRNAFCATVFALSNHGGQVMQFVNVSLSGSLSILFSGERK
jgi:hypothetical protein